MYHTLSRRHRTTLMTNFSLPQQMSWKNIHAPMLYFVCISIFITEARFSYQRKSRIYYGNCVHITAIAYIIRLMRSVACPPSITISNHQRHHLSIIYIPITEVTKWIKSVLVCIENIARPPTGAGNVIHYQTQVYTTS